MAITPRTVLSQPISLLLFAFSILALGGVLGVLAGASHSGQRSLHAGAIPSAEQARLDAGVVEPGDGEAAGLAGSVEVDRRDLTCRLQAPGQNWSEGQWLRHLGCMEARGEGAELLLAETNQAIGALGVTPELALKKADYLKEVRTDDERIEFLDAAVIRLGVSDGRLVHRLARALTWRGELEDLERIRHLQLLSHMLMPDSCEVLQTDIWVRYALAEQMAQEPSPAAWQGVGDAISTYLAADCHLRYEMGRHEPSQIEPSQIKSNQLDILTEMLGVGVVAEATNGHAGESTLIRQVAESNDLRAQDDQVRSLCRAAVPAGVGLRGDCEKRLGDELYLAR